METWNFLIQIVIDCCFLKMNYFYYFYDDLSQMMMIVTLTETCHWNENVLQIMNVNPQNHENLQMVIWTQMQNLPVTHVFVFCVYFYYYCCHHDSHYYSLETQKTNCTDWAPEHAALSFHLDIGLKDTFEHYHNVVWSCDLCITLGF